MYCNASSSCRVQSTICISENFFSDCVYSTIFWSRSPPYTTTYLTATTYNLHDCQLLESESKQPSPYHHLCFNVSLPNECEKVLVFFHHFFLNRTSGINCTGFYRPCPITHSYNSTNSVKAMTPNRNTGLILSSPITRLLKEGPLLPLCWLSRSFWLEMSSMSF